MMTTWSGRERAWVKLLSSPASRIDVAAPTARVMRHAVERGAPIAAALVGVAAFAANATPVADPRRDVRGGRRRSARRRSSSFVALHFARAQLEALASGITYKDARAFERAAAANVAVLSARGTVLLGEPEIVAIEPIGGAEVGRVLSLAAGAETASTHPFAAAILRAARARGVGADHVRNATAHAGLGVTALAVDGRAARRRRPRASCSRRRSASPSADARIAELEAQGRSVLLVALGDRLVGLLALQDGLRAGRARGRAAAPRRADRAGAAERRGARDVRDDRPRARHRARAAGGPAGRPRRRGAGARRRPAASSRWSGTRWGTTGPSARPTSRSP